MNAASQLLRVLALIGAIAAGALFWLSKGKVDTLTRQLSQAQAAANTSKSGSDQDLQNLKDQVTKDAADKEALQRQFKDATDKADLADQRFAAAKADVDAANDAAKAKDAKIDALNAQVTDLTAKAAVVDDLTKDNASLKTRAEALQSQLNDLIAKTTPAPGKSPAGSAASSGSETPATPVQLSAASSAKVVQVDSKNYLLVLDLGDASGVQKDSQLYLKVGDQPLGVVVVTDTKNNMAVCAVASTNSMSYSDFSKIVTAGLKVDYQRAL
ncbi:MAG TPA: hypothetical protein VHC95_06015 [Opitutales bacterium]|nr:hypothetical protein [Opitutales bacterium]